MNRAPPGGRSKALPTTLCQKCLKRGHYSYECTVTTQQRPYRARPSRTQQLLNPNLKQTLTTEVPSDLLRRKDIADEILAKKDEERATNRPSHRRSRSRSPSSYSSDSVSTISTNRSRSRSPPTEVLGKTGRVSASRGQQKLGKRGRSSSFSGSDRSESSHELRRYADKNTRRRVSSFSPPQRGRRRSRSRTSRMDMLHENGSPQTKVKRETSDGRCWSRSHSRGGSPKWHQKRNLDGKRRGRRPSLSRSRSRSSGRMDISDERIPPQNRDVRAGRSPKRRLPTARQLSTSRSPSRSLRDGRRGRMSRSDSSLHAARSPSPFSRKALPRSPSPFRSQNSGRGRGGPYGGRGRGGHQNGGGRQLEEPNSRNGSLQQKERSLSPYSKRVALTRQMHGEP